MNTSAHVILSALILGRGRTRKNRLPITIGMAFASFLLIRCRTPWRYVGLASLGL